MVRERLIAEPGVIKLQQCILLHLLRLDRR